jgi:pentatricopeptide repeat protein
MEHTSSVPDDKGNFIKDGSNRDNHEINPDPDYLEAERFWMTDDKWPAIGPYKPQDTNNTDKTLTLAIPSSLEFRKVQAGPPKSRTSKSKPAPETPPSRGSWQSMEENPEAVAYDEALDAAEQVEHHGPKENYEPPKALAVGNGLTRRAPLFLSRRDHGQLRVLRLTSERHGKNYATESVDYTSWKRLFKEVSSPESKSPSSIELRMHHGVLALDSADSMANFLSYPSPEHKQKARNRILLYTTLRHAPEKGAMVLKALLSVSHLPFYMVEDSLGFLAYHLRKMEPAMKQHCAQILADLVVQTTQPGKEGHIRPTQSTIYNILIALPPTRLEDWFHQITAHQVSLHKYTLLQFASRFAKTSATKDLSLDVWRDLCETRSIDINSPVGASFCTSLLTFKEDDLHTLDDKLATPAELFQSLLDMGLIPNAITYTTIIRSLCVKKDLQTAMAVYEVMKQHGVQPDNFTHSVMMNGFKSCGDFTSMLRFATDARGVCIRDAVVWNDVIHATFLACLKEPRAPGGLRRARCVVWGPMNAIFARFFNPMPLRTLITAEFSNVREFMEKQGFIPSRMRGAFQEIQQQHPQELIQPTSSTLSLMILGFIRHCPRPNDVVRFYDHFKKLLREGNPVAQSIVDEQGSIVHDIVIRALLKWKGTLRIMLSIIRDMMSDTQPAAAVNPNLSLQMSESQINDSELVSATNIQQPAVDSNNLRLGADDTVAADNVIQADGQAVNREESTLATSLADAPDHHGKARPAIRHPRPSVHTWSILLKGFMSNRLMREAEYVLELMQHHGVKPNIVTWNTLAAEYAKVGSVGSSVEAMRRLEAAGFTSDDWTMRAFSYIRDKAKAIRLMEQKVEENKAMMDEFDEIMGHKSELEEDDMALYHQQEVGTAPEDGEWPPSEQILSAGKGAQRDVRESGGSAGKPQPPHQGTQKPVAKPPAPKRLNMGVWDDILWSHAADSGSAEQDKREDSAA